MPTNHEVIFVMVHDLEKMAPHFKILKEYVGMTAKACPARGALDKIEVIMNKVMVDGCTAVEATYENKIIRCDNKLPDAKLLRKCLGDLHKRRESSNN